jgi:hypothetical protein
MAVPPVGDVCTSIQDRILPLHFWMDPTNHGGMSIGWWTLVIKMTMVTMTMTMVMISTLDTLEMEWQVPTTTTTTTTTLREWSCRLQQCVQKAW